MNQVEAHWHTLQRHPAAPVPIAHEQLVIKACAQRINSDLAAMRYCVLGDLAEFVMPPFGPLKRGDDLWRSTCFEAFLAPKPGGPYVEMNASPSGAWAFYSFDGYRKRSSARAALCVEGIETTLQPQEFHITARVCGLEELSAVRGSCKLGLSVVMEDHAGGFSYWALAHAPGKPDFHHDATFMATL